MQLQRHVILDKTITIPSNDITYIRHEMNHVGKTNHYLTGTFEVEQVQANVESKVKFYVFDDSKLISWITNKISAYNYTFFINNKNFVLKTESSHGEFRIPIHGNATVYFVVSNRYMLTVAKPMTLRIFEEWEEEDNAIKIVTTEPPHIESLKSQIEEMLNKATESLLIISPYFDMSLINKLVQKRDEGVDVKIILKNDPEIKGLAKQGREQIQKNFPKQHKMIKDIHARLIISDSKEVLISSADLTQNSLQVQQNLGIYVNDINTVQNVIKFFYNVWNRE
ncbi:MAG: hypothetical protein IH841_07940 [Thaumarchaeota archaeon]|nr:hypothetical protein [Nitrososphaerota archaeon]